MSKGKSSSFFSPHSEDTITGGRELGGGLNTQLCAPHSKSCILELNKSKQLEFHKHFENAAQNERVFNYFACDLEGLFSQQGYLYITRNYFAFHTTQNVLETKILIPLSSVMNVTRENIDYHFSSAVGIETENGKHVFCHLLSADRCYQLMLAAWLTATTPRRVQVSFHAPKRKEREDSHLSSYPGDKGSGPRYQSGENLPTAHVPKKKCLEEGAEEDLDDQIKTSLPNDCESTPSSSSNTSKSHKELTEEDDESSSQSLITVYGEESTQSTVWDKH